MTSSFAEPKWWESMPHDVPRQREAAELAAQYPLSVTMRLMNRCVTALLKRRTSVA